MKSTMRKLLLVCFGVAASFSDAEDSAPQGTRQTPESEGHPAIARLNQIVIPKVAISDATVEEAFDFARQLSIRHDPEKDAARKGVSMIVRRPKAEEEPAVDGGPRLKSVKRPAGATINFSSEKISYLDLIAEIARQAKLDAYLTSVGIMVVPEGHPPFPNAKADEGEVWKTLRQTPQDNAGQE